MRKECGPLNLSQLRGKIAWFAIPAAAIALAIFILSPQSQPEHDLAETLTLVQAEPPQQTETPPLQSALPETMMIDIKGQVASPGVFELPTGARVKDAIAAAGGFLDNADPKAINLAMRVQDEMVIYVPAIGEEAPLVAMPTGGGSSQSSSDGLININTATDAELMELTGIGPSKAAAIIAYRTENGNFAKIEDLTNVTGIGDKTFEQLKDGITVQ